MRTSISVTDWAEEIINALAQFPGVNVTARTSSFAFRGKEQDIRKIAEILDVRTILEGSVRRAGSRIRVTAQLISAANGYHLWSDRYDRELADVFAIQDEIAQAIAGALKVKLARRHHTPVSAYEAFLKARHFLAKWTPQSIFKAKESLDQQSRSIPNLQAEMGACFVTLAAVVVGNPIYRRSATSPHRFSDPAHLARAVAEGNGD
jgi:TolB-like protein